MDIDDNETLIAKSIKLSALFAFSSQKEVRRNYNLKNGYFQIIDKHKAEPLWRITLSDGNDYYDQFYINPHKKNKQYLVNFYIIEIEQITVIKEKDKPIKFHILDIVNADTTIKAKIDNPIAYGTERKIFTTPSKILSFNQSREDSSGQRFNGNLSITFDEERNEDRPYTFSIFNQYSERKRTSVQKDKENRGCRSAAQIVSNISINSKKRSYIPLALLSGLNSQLIIKVRLQNYKLNERFRKYLLNVIDEDATTATIMVKSDHFRAFQDTIKDFKTYYLSGNYRLGGNQERKILIIMESNVKFEQANDVDEIPLSRNVKINISQIEELYVQGITMCDMFLFVIRVKKMENGDDFRFAKIKVSDSTEFLINLLISKEQYENRDINPGCVLFITELTIHFDKGYYLSTNRNSIIEVNLDMPERYKLKLDNPITKQYIKHKHAFSNHKSLIKTVPISYLLKRKEEKRKFERFDNLFIKAKVKNIVHKAENVYRKCKDCKRSTRLTDDNRYICENRHLNVNPDYAYCLKLTLLDISGRCDVVLYNEIAQKLLGISAHEYFSAVSDIEHKADILYKAVSKVEFMDFYFLIRVGYKSNNSLNPVELNLINFEEFDNGLYNKHLIDSLNKRLNIK
jgi:hypothetical protein